MVLPWQNDFNIEFLSKRLNSIKTLHNNYTPIKKELAKNTTKIQYDSYHFHFHIKYIIWFVGQSLCNQMKIGMRPRTLPFNNDGMHLS